MDQAQALFGQVPQELLQEAGEQTDAVFEVWPENWDAVLLFLALRNQWHWVGAGLGGAMRTGLDLQAAKLEMEMAGLDTATAKTVWAQLKVMEDEALDVWAARAEQNRKD